MTPLPAPSPTLASQHNQFSSQHNNNRGVNNSQVQARLRQDFDSLLRDARCGSANGCDGSASKSFPTSDAGAPNLAANSSPCSRNQLISLASAACSTHSLSKSDSSLRFSDTSARRLSMASCKSVFEAFNRKSTICFSSMTRVLHDQSNKPIAQLSY